MERRDSVILFIKNQIIPDEYFVCYDKGWNAFFFPHITNEYKDVDSLQKAVAKQFDICTDQVIMHFLGEGQEVKPCVEHNNEIRNYHYMFYTTELLHPFWHRTNIAHVKDIEYRWKTLEELMNDAGTKNCNTYVIQKAKELSQ